MASAYFKTEVDVLQQLTQHLQDAEDCMDSAMRAMKDETSGRIGTPELDGACADFQKAWSYGLEQMKASSKDLVDGLSATTKNYHQVEQALADEMRKLGQNIPAQGAA
jgi:hypothetical protein